MVLALPPKRLPSLASLCRRLQAGVRFAAVLLVLCGLTGAALHVHHGSGSETCAVCVHARTPAATTSITALPLPARPTGEVAPTAEVAFESTAGASSADSRAPPSVAPAA